MFYDSPLTLSNAQAITTTAASTTIYDVTGAGSGNAPVMSFGNGKPGFDIAGAPGHNDGATAYFTIITTGTGAGTITMQVKAAPDNGSNAPGTYKVLTSTDAIVGTTLIAGDVYALPIPPYNAIKAGMGVPRFYEFNYVVSGSATVTVTGVILIGPTTGYEVTQYANNFIAV